MKLNAFVVYEELRKTLSVRMEGKPRDEVMFGRAEFVAGDNVQFQKGHLYLGFCDQLPKRPSLLADVIIVCLGANPPAAYANERCIRLVVDQVTNIFHVANALTEIFDKFEAWDEALVEAADQGRDLAHTVQLSEEIFGNPVLLANRHFRYISYSRQIDEDPRLEEFRPDLDGMVSLARVAEGLKDQPINMTEQKPMRGHSLFDLLSVNLFDGARYVGSATVVYANGTPQEGHRQLVAHLGKRLESQLKRHPELRYSENDAVRKSVSHMLDGLPVDPSEWRRASKAITESHFVCVKARPRDLTREAPADYLCGMFEENIANCVAVMHADAIVAVVNTTPEAVDDGSLESEVRYVLEQAQLYGGMSDAYSDMMSTRPYYRQASVALERGREKDPDDYCHKFCDHVLSYMIEHCSGEFSDTMTYARGLKAVIEHDRNAGSEYVRTLRTYLDNNMNVAQTARELFIHRTSLMARLERIERLMGLDLSNADNRLHLALNLRMAKAREERGKEG